MSRLLEKHADAIAELRRRHGVRKLELFGSAAAGTFEPDRSVDLVEPRAINNISFAERMR
jgi:predicted nucleotidyltransferase